MYLWPRLGPGSHTELIERLLARSPEDLRREATNRPHHDTLWYPTGTRVPYGVIERTACAARAVADAEGWPDLDRSERRRRRFDQRIGAVLHEEMQIVPADAAHPWVWANLCLVVLPDLARWRYPEHNRERYTSTYRNVFGRLWWRAHRLGAGPDDPPTRLLEDQAVAIFERAGSLAGRPALARALADAVLAHPRNSQALMRHTAIRILRLLAVVDVGVLAEDELRRLVQDEVESAACALD